jgi:hypothetical protein
MSGEMVRDRAFLGLLFVVGGSSLLWGLYELFYVSTTSATGVFNTVLGLMVLLVTWAFLVPYVVPSAHGDPTPGTAPVYRPYLSKPVAPAQLPKPRPAPRRTPVPAPVPTANLDSAPAWRPSVRAAAPARISRAPLEPLAVEVLRPPVVPAPLGDSPLGDEEIDDILADLPDQLDADLAAASADEVIRRLDALLRDLSGGEDRAPTVPPV